MIVAAPPAKAAQGQGPCADDVQKFCKDVQPGGGRIARCLKEHESEFSPECKERWNHDRGNINNRYRMPAFATFASWRFKDFWSRPVPPSRGLSC
jgi:hypothetical protein